MRFAQTYKAYGEFGFFTLLFVTTTDARISSIREQTNLTGALSQYYRFATFDATQSDFCAAIWKARNPTDATLYPLVRE